MIKCHIFTPSEKHLELDTDIVSFDAPDSRRGIISGHMPIVISVEVGRFSTLLNGHRVHYAIGEGILYFSNNEAKFLVDSIEEQSEIDIQRAYAAKERAYNRLHTDTKNVDIQRAELALRKANNRIAVANYKE